MLSGQLFFNYLRVMIDVVLIGAGNVAIHLARAFKQADDIRLVQRYNRSSHNSTYFDSDIPFTDSVKNLKKADVYVIAVKDDAIETITQKIGTTNILLAHTSGSKGLESIMSDAPKAVFYPLQTFTADKTVNFREIPVCIETDTAENRPLLQKLALSISPLVYELNGHQRKKLHLAAVFANNFTNHLFKIAHDICKANQIDFEILKPLINETVSKLSEMIPLEAQTGPARRNDQGVIRAQANQLNGLEKEIYELITLSIQKTYTSNGKKL